MKKQFATYWVIAWLFFGLAGTSGAQTYSIKLLEKLDSSYGFTIPTSINDIGQVVGFTGYSPQHYDKQYHAVLWENGQVKDLGGPRGEYIYNYADDINNLGQILGHTEIFGWGDRPYSLYTTLQQNGNTINLGSHSYHQAGWLTTEYGYKNNSINDNGQVAGTSLLITSDGYYYPQATLVTDDEIIYLGVIGSVSYAVDINNNGQVVGNSSTAEGSQFAVLFENGNVSILSGINSNATAINNNGQAVGTNWNLRRAVLWENGTETALENLYGGEEEARDINDYGQIVGLSGAGSVGGLVAMLWQNGTVTDLNTLIDDPRWRLYCATGINNSGQIIGYGRFSGEGAWYSAFLLTPNSTPCPSDLEGNDMDVDGADISVLANNTSLIDIENFAANFGRTSCVLSGTVTLSTVDPFTNFQGFIFADEDVTSETNAASINGDFGTAIEGGPMAFMNVRGTVQIKKRASITLAQIATADESGYGNGPTGNRAGW